MHTELARVMLRKSASASASIAASCGSAVAQIQRRQFGAQAEVLLGLVAANGGGHPHQRFTERQTGLILQTFIRDRPARCVDGSLALSRGEEALVDLLRDVREDGREGA